MQLKPAYVWAESIVEVLVRGITPLNLRIGSNDEVLTAWSVLAVRACITESNKLMIADGVELMCSEVSFDEATRPDNVT